MSTLDDVIIRIFDWWCSDIARAKCKARRILAATYEQLGMHPLSEVAIFSDTSYHHPSDILPETTAYIL